ncbi:DUF11 domain-containing protein [Sphingomonas sp. SUN019]|uniref:DUF11 domain-containing protein n=1 Tax=Sphingomonas sp. SUN019 TaxID=2937788 RepID=UPI002164835E|nr:DUF11 domain-containing protein [Sphingomonas sp. SUN019]UVO51294.1 DUF11 domain-containing protein [Sphingomonas sp. SUN019]
MKKAFLISAIALALTPVAAAADCDAANRYGFLFANQAAATLTYGSTYNYTASTTGGATRAFSMTPTQNGLSSTQAGGAQMPAITTLVTGPDATKRDLVLGGTFAGRTADIASGTRVVSVTFTFAQPIRDFAIKVHDVDFTANQYRDWLMVTGVGAGVTYTPAMTTPWGNSNAAGGARTNASSSVTVGASSTPIALTAAQGAGSGASGNNSDTGTVTATFAQPVTTITVRYGNAPFTSGETATGQQAIGIEGISFCPMPQVSVTKTSAPVGTHALPGGDVRYTFTVTNTGGSPVDAGTIVLTDVLPAAITFRNIPLDPGTGAPFDIAPGNSGMTMTNGSGVFSNTGGSTFGYAPVVGYDPAVNAIRIAPSGTMAASSTFSVSFVAAIK